MSLGVAEVALATAGIQAAREAIKSIVLQMRLRHQAGQITDEQLAHVEAEADLSDERRDRLVDEARQRLAARRNGS